MKLNSYTTLFKQHSKACHVYTLQLRLCVSFFSLTGYQSCPCNTLNYRLFGTRPPPLLQHTINNIEQNEQRAGGTKFNVDLTTPSRVVTLIGRPNVGKSTLFNTILCNTRVPKQCEYLNSKAIVSDIPGTTRNDKLSRAIFGGFIFDIMDTPGIVPSQLYETTNNILLKTMAEQTLMAISQSDLVLFLINIQDGITADDLKVIHEVQSYITHLPLKTTLQKELRVLPMILVANKSDTVNYFNEVQECYNLNLGHPVFISSLHYKGLEELRLRIIEELRPYFDFEKEYQTREKQDRINDIPLLEPLSTINVDQLDETVIYNEAAIQRLKIQEKHLTDITLNGTPISPQCSTDPAIITDHYKKQLIDNETEYENAAYKKAVEDDIQFVREMYGDLTQLHTNSNGSQHTTVSHMTTHAIDKSNTTTKDMRQLYAWIDSTMQPLPPPPAVRLTKWLKNKAQVNNWLTEEIHQHIVLKVEKDQQTKFNIETSRLDLATAESFILETLSNKTQQSHSMHDNDSNPTGSTNSNDDSHVYANQAANDYHQILTTNPFMGDYFPINMRPNRLRKNADRRDAIMQLRHLYMQEDNLRIVLVGAPNAGKSSLTNALSNTNRVIVHSIQGTTTDSIPVPANFNGRQVCLIDTAGLSSKWRMTADLFQMKITADILRCVAEAQIAIIVVDGTQKSPNLTPYQAFIKQELDLLSMIVEHYGKIAIIAVNKWDLVPSNERLLIRKHIMDSLEHIREYTTIPVVFLSAKNQLNMSTLITRCIESYNRWHIRVPTGRLNKWLEAFVTQFPPPWHRGSKVKLSYIVQMQIRPPLFVLYTSVYGSFPKNYKIMIQKHIIEEFGMYGSPIRLLLRTMSPPPKENKSAYNAYAERLKYKRKKPNYENRFELPIGKEGRKINLQY